VRACASRYRRITSTLRSPRANFTTGISLARANESTPRRNLVPIFSKIAGEGIDNPKCRVMNETTCPPTCRVGTYPLR